jgi:hypothetical protein
MWHYAYLLDLKVILAQRCTPISSAGVYGAPQEARRVVRLVGPVSSDPFW